MSFFSKLFGQNNEVEQPQPQIKFGRYTDSYKTKFQYDNWDKALDQFEEENYLESYRAFFNYLKDERENNVNFEEEDGQIKFEILQGSKRVIGFANKKHFKAEAKVARANKMNIGFMRRLIEQNFDLKYSRFALNDSNDILILFDTYTLDGSPYKLYYALKELATNADKQDDLLVDEFEMLNPLEISHLKNISEAEKSVKYDFTISEIKAVFEEMDNGRLNPDQYPGAMGYMLLNLSYKLDYLTKPEGFMMETLERIHRLYFTNDGNSMSKKNAILRKEFQRLLERPKEDFFKEMYEVPATFGITSPVNHDKVASVIEGELGNMDWYKDHKHFKVALAIPGYIAGHSMFQYAVPKPDRDLFHLYHQIVESDYFQKLGFTLNYYNPQKEKFDQKGIKKAIKDIVENNKEDYPDINPDLTILRFDSICNFAKSYMQMIQKMEVVKRER
jgi:hypothetical protein